uniref:Rap guanine nucleotide exchange factor (GEF)-like 1 n=1 Tax=Poecilia reticulata TaxID=8081 RepID=A0A3P9P713_POERE
MPAGMKPLEKFLKKQTTALTRAGGFGGMGDKASGGTGASRRRASLSRVVPFFRETSPESGHAREVFTLLDDFMLTHPIFLTADRLQQVLLQFSLEAERRDGEAEAAMSAAERKQAVLNMAFRYLDTYRELLQEEGERSNSFPKELYMCAVQELTRYPELVEDVLKLQRWSEILHCSSDEEKESRKKQVRPLFRHFRRIDACLQPREAFRGSDEFCRVYTPDHSYVTIRSRLSCRVGEILALVKEKLQYSEDQPVLPGNLILVAVTSAGKAVFRPSDEAVFTTLGVNTHLFACEPSELDSLLTFLHESCKTFHGELVNFEKMLQHKVAEMVRTIRRYRSSQLIDTETSPSHLQTKAYVRQLQVIDNQNLLFDMSCKLEPKDT